MMIRILSRSPLAVIALASAALVMSAPAAADSDAGPAAPKMHRSAKSETIDQRISGLHASLKITPEEEGNWAAVAQVMRDNDAALRKLVVARETASPQPLTAVDDLKAYQQFAQAHADGLRALISSFDTLYGTMPDAQKAIADKVFQHEHAAHAGRASVR